MDKQIIEKTKNLAKDYSPVIMSSVLLSIAAVIGASFATAKRVEGLYKAGLITEQEYYNWRKKAIRRGKSNNWLKRHGYPMRRRGI